MSTATKRSPFWDNIKGILIFLVVFAHFLYDFRSSNIIRHIVDAIYLFHMPAFVFVSGYLSKSSNSRSKRSLIRLGVIYLIFNTFMLIFFGVKKGHFYAVTPYYSTWYILALIVWRTIAERLSKIRNILIWLTVISIISGLWQDIDNTLAISRIISFSPFFMAGYLFDEKKMEKRISHKTFRTVSVGTAMTLFAAIVALSGLKLFRFAASDLTITGYADLSDLIKRVIMLAVSLLMIAAMTRLSPDRNIPFFSQIGRNSLGIYLCHRPITLWVSRFFGGSDAYVIIGLSFACTLFVCLVFGSDITAKIISKAIDGVTDFLGGKIRFSVVTKLACLVLVAFLALSPAISSRDFWKMESLNYSEKPVTPVSTTNDKIYRVITPTEKASFENAFKIIFSGDLILLEDQVKRGYNGEGYDFSDMFMYTEKYISSADMAIGVFEGPLAGEEAGYTSSNYDDGKELFLNFPDEFAVAVKNAGYDLVTLANNHLLDKGAEGAMRTLDVLDRIGLDNTGSYRNAEEKASERVKIIEKDGIKFALLSYTYGCNYYFEEDFVSGEYSYATSVLASPDGENFQSVKESVRKDFEEAKSHNPDLIIVLPHMGTQFLDAPDKYQTTWCSLFKEFGADIILSDHTHSVQPVEFEIYGEKNIFTAHCPGNYANIYREYNGDASAMIEVYIDKTTKEVIGGGVIPMWTYSNVDGNYTPVPIYDIVKNPQVRKTITTDDMKRVKEVQDHITGVMLGEKVGLDMIQEVYYFTRDGFRRCEAEKIDLDENMENGLFLQKCKDAESVCFVGDSITQGTKNGGCPWYEPIIPYLSGSIYNCSWGGGTVSTLIDNSDEIKNTHAEVYVIAIGTNDVRYRDESLCSMTAQEYVDGLRRLVEIIRKDNPDAEFIFIAPWTSTDGDPYCKMSFAEKMKMNGEYSDALEKMCVTDGHTYINPNGYINRQLTLYPTSKFLLDHIHPGYLEGVGLYSKAVLSYS